MPAAIVAAVAFAAGVVGVSNAVAQLPLPIPVPGQPPLPDLPAGGHSGNGDRKLEAVRIKTSPASQKALVRTIPITRRRARHPVSVASVKLRTVGELRRRIRLEAGAELQTTVCLRRKLGRHRNGVGCAGRIYGYDPKIRVQLVLAPGPKVAKPRHTAPLGPAQTVRCKQRQPNRNHHCAIDLGWRSVRFGPGASKLPPCAPRSCRVNLVASASNPRARKHQRVVVGGLDRDGSVDNRGESRISAIRYTPRAKTPAPLRARGARFRALPLVRAGAKIKPRSVYSVAIPRPRAGEKLRIDARYLAALARLPYNARTRMQLILADSPRATRPGANARRVAASPAFLSPESNFNCTRGPSAFRTPCPVGKLGVVRFEASSPDPVYVNLLVGHGVIGFGARRHRHSDRIRVRRGGYLKVWRFHP